MSETKLQPGLITLHGIDGSGKTTTADYLVQHLVDKGLSAVNYDRYEVGLESPYRQIKKEIKHRPFDEQLAFFLASTLFHSHQIEVLISQGMWVVKSRYLLDVLAHYSHLGCKNVETIAIAMPFLQPTLQIILVLDEFERQSRIKNRPIRDEKDMIPKEMGTRAWFFEEYLLRYAGIIHSKATTKTIDTTVLGKESVANQIARVLWGTHNESI